MTQSETAPSRRMLLAPFVILFAAIVVHGLYWVIMSVQIETRAQAWIEDHREAGYEIAYERLSVDGYPFRFALRAEAAALTAPAADGGWRLHAPRVAATAQFYNLNHWIIAVDAPGEFAARTDAGLRRYRLDASSARLSLAGAGGATTRIGAELDALVLTALDGPSPALSRIERLVASGYVGADDTLTARIQIENADFARDQLEPGLEAAFGQTAGLVRMEAAVTEWAALAASGDLAAWTRAGGHLEVSRAQLVWGPADVSGAGDVALDSSLRPSGRLSVVVTDPETLISALVEAGLVHENQGDALRLAAMMAPPKADNPQFIGRESWVCGRTVKEAVGRPVRASTNLLETFLSWRKDASRDYALQSCACPLPIVTRFLLLSDSLRWAL